MKLKMKLNKERQQMYLNGTVGLINDGTVEQLWEIAADCTLRGDSKYYYAKVRPTDGMEYHHTIWFYEPEMRKPTAWKLNIDVPEWRLEKDMVGIIDKDMVANFAHAILPNSILQHIATPIYGTKIKLESGAEIELSENDIENIKKL